MFVKGSTTVIPVTIASGSTDSSAIDVGGHTMLAIYFPTGFTGSTVTFKGSSDGTTYYAIYSGGAAVSETVVANSYVSIDANITALTPYRFLKIVADAQSGARTMHLLAKS